MKSYVLNDRLLPMQMATFSGIIPSEEEGVPFSSDYTRLVRTTYSRLSR